MLFYGRIDDGMRIFLSPLFPNIDTLPQNGQLLFVCYDLLSLIKQFQSVDQFAEYTEVQK